MHGNTPRWAFRETSDGEPERLPRESEFFVGGSLDVAGSLVRETIQNSLDARQTVPVRVRFAFISQRTSQARRFYEGLVEHLRASGLAEGTGINNDCLRLLLAEDFNTCGLTGAVRGDELEEGCPSNFYNFWWREGIAQKRGASGGRWGLGKVTFHVASRIRSIWGLTVRQDDGRALLLGKCLLKPHRIEGKRFDCYGYFSDDRYRPVEGAAALDDFRQAFGISRGAEPGLSIAIPCVREDVTPDTTVRAAIMHYFLPILRGELVVEVQSEDGSSTEVSRSNVREIAQAQSWQERGWRGQDIDSLMDFAESATQLERSANMSAIVVQDGTASITQDGFGDRLELLRETYRSGQVMGFRIPLVIRPVDAGSQHSYFDVFVQKNESLDRAQEFCWRSGILIPDVRSLRRQRVRALLSATDEAVCALLGDCETPAHTDWNERTEGFASKYLNARAALRSIKRSVREIVGVLDMPPTRRQPDFLTDVFHLPASEGNVAVEVKPPTPPTARPAPALQVSAARRGFRLYMARDAQVNLPTTAELAVAYDVRRGDPFRSYSQWDFDLRNMRRTMSGGRELAVSGNTMLVEVHSRRFRLYVAGFDPRRDVVVRALVHNSGRP